MKLGESKEFRDLCIKVINYYDIWNLTSDTPPTTERACIMGGNEEDTTCLIVFNGNREDCFAIRDFLDSRDKKK